VLSAAKRELREETELEANLWLCGTVIVDSGRNPGICLFVFSGESFGGEPKASREGTGEWADYDALDDFPVVEDLPILLERIHRMKRGDTPFAARSYYDESARLVVEFAEE
jgi:8-oxo-dGTP pyrophosphatase MutT (NUDIX family)